MLGPASEKQAMVLQNEANILVVGGAAGGGKSYVSLMLALKYIHDPNTRAVYFRRTTGQVSGQGGLYDSSKEIFLGLPPSHKPQYKDSKLECRFPSGAHIKFSHMELERNKLDWQGLQLSLVVFDETAHFTWTQIEYLMSRLRSSASYDSRMILTMNPDPDHKVAELIRWWLDDEGYPREDRCGVIRWFIRRDGDFIWGDSSEELKEKYGDECLPVSFSFIGMTITDNPPLIKSNPGYLAMLEGLNPVDKARLRYGNWFARPKGSNYLERDWLIKAENVPLNAKACRAWDKASSEPSDVNKTPDFTASVKMYKTSEGLYYITGDYVEDNMDKDYELYGKFRKRPGERDRIIEKQSSHDGQECTIVFPVDPGASGAVEFQQSARKLIEKGFQVKKDPAPSNANKLTKFTPFSSAAENGLVYIVESTFRDKRTLDAFYKELEAFDGTRSTAHRKDD